MNTCLTSVLDGAGHRGIFPKPKNLGVFSPDYLDLKTALRHIRTGTWAARLWTMLLVAVAKDGKTSLPDEKENDCSLSAGITGLDVSWGVAKAHIKIVTVRLIPALAGVCAPHSVNNGFPFLFFSGTTIHHEASRAVPLFFGGLPLSLSFLFRFNLNLNP